MTVKLTLIRGLPGSGKSTLAQTFNAQHLEADMFFIEPSGEYLYQPDKIADAHQWCQAMTEHCLKEKRDVVVSNTFVQRWEIVPYFNMAKRYGAEFEVLECTNDYGNIHGVTQETINSMRKRWQSWRNARQSSK
ncbi:ATP-binding protein [Vibrio sinaloensis]|uniref:ATP-binding protein n=1 Tax=Photobacterium sp. (strain ATCC 43367) TaxID=379097 RepID=UPI0022AE69BF|nr:ATP-binding protein [Vibrio sinaloensis]MCZ4294599.1 ATP-binding protein [Vibrio sinaloensis]